MSLENPSKIVSVLKKDDYDVVSQFCRYNSLNRIVNEDGVTYIETPDKVELPESANDSLYQVTDSRRNRLDIISYDFYNTPLLWWVIAMVNHINNPFDVPSGIILRIPHISKINSLGLNKKKVK